MLKLKQGSALLRTRPRLLLVDDDSQLLDLSCSVLTLSGYSVFTATNPNKAIGLAKRQRPDLMIVDYRMPVMDGCTLADRLRVIMPRLPVILYSGALDIPNSELSKVNAFVPKSDGVLTLLHSVARLLASANSSGHKVSSENPTRMYSARVVGSSR
jgi:CheY-like chemotaxis protein